MNEALTASSPWNKEGENPRVLVPRWRVLKKDQLREEKKEGTGRRKFQCQSCNAMAFEVRGASSVSEKDR